MSGIPDTELPPYSLLSTPVYSLSTAGDAEGRNATLNMMTYASPVALRPKRFYAIGLYKQTLSYENMAKTRTGVLQILQQQHAQHFQLLGKTSGRDVDKIAALRSAGVRLTTRHGLTVLEDSLGIMHLRMVGDFTPCGDHEVAVCEMVSWETLATEPEQRNPLYTGFLKEQGYL